jgi:gamma-glutamylcyclotransferase (GGCT)/AIG2-like uncharacterized protein YtfP
VTRLFVYGTLRAQGSQHHRLAGARALGPARTRPELTLLDLGWHPALVQPGHTAVVGELYEVDAVLLAALDEFEGVPAWYQRVLLVLEDGAEAETYVMRAADAGPRPEIDGGDWIAYARARDG